MTQPATPSSTQKTMVLRECGICQSPIFPDDATTTCSKCSLTYHAECWTENFGCASYGCEQVDALKPRESETQTPVEYSQPIAQSIERLPWNFVLLGAAAISMAVSTTVAVAVSAVIPPLISWLLYGAPSALVFTAIVVRIVQTRLRGVRLVTQPILVVAAILSLIGFICGMAISIYLHR